MLLKGESAMNGFCGVPVADFTGSALTAAPLKSGSVGAGGADVIGSACALPATTSEVNSATRIPEKSPPILMRTDYGIND